jgi:hypothetical protein
MKMKRVKGRTALRPKKARPRTEAPVSNLPKERSRDRAPNQDRANRTVKPNAREHFNKSEGTSQNQLKRPLNLKQPPIERPVESVVH